MQAEAPLNPLILNNPFVLFPVRVFEKNQSQMSQAGQQIQRNLFADRSIGVCQSPVSFERARFPELRQPASLGADTLSVSLL